MRIRGEVRLRNVAGEHIVMGALSGMVNMARVVSLNETSVWLWERLVGTDFTIEQVAELLQLEYEIDAETATHDATVWVEQMRNAELVCD